MKKITLLCLVFVVGCSSTPKPPPSIESQQDFIPYIGQQPVWPTAPGAFAKTLQGVPIYARDQYPSQPYDVLGRVNTDDTGRVIYLARLANADAAILISAQIETTGISTTSGASGNATLNANSSSNPYAPPPSTSIFGNTFGWAHSVLDRKLNARWYLIKYKKETP